MTDEKKTYLINIESNLKKYAEEAAEAKKKVDELKAANDALKQSGTATTAEIEANNAALRNAQKEYTQAKKMVDLQTAANKSEVGSRKQLGEILKLQEQELGKLGKAYIVNAQGVRILNPLYIEQRNRIAETKKAIIDYDQALNDGRSNVGRYGDAVKSAMTGIGISLKETALSFLSFATIAALATKAIGAIKDAFFSTDEGMGVLRRWSEAAKTFFYGIINKSDKGDIKASMQAADELEKLRVEERKELLKIAELETDIKLLRLQAADASIGAKKQLELLTEAEKKENEIITTKKNHLIEEIRAYEMLWMTRKEDSDLLDIITQKRVELERLEGEKSLRIASKISATKEKIAKEDQARFDEEQKRIKEGQKALQDEIDAYNKAREERRKQEIIAEKEGQDFIDREIKRMEDAAEKERERKLIDFENEIVIREANNEWLYNTERERLELQRQAEIANAEKTGADVLTINKKYAAVNRQIDEAEQVGKLGLYADFAGNIATIFGENTAIGRTAAVVQTTIATYTAAMEAYKSLAGVPIVGPVLGVAAAAAAVAAGIANIKKILATKSGLPGDSGGGSISVPTSISASVPAQRTFATPAGSTLLTQPQLSQQQLNALPSQNLLTADDIARALSKMPAPVVTVEDINAKIKEKNKVDVRANI
jgi:hypothetical protein